MSQIKWADATSYSQGQWGIKDPTSFECVVNGVRIWISKGHRYYPEEWVLTCRSLDIDCREFAKSDEMDTETAQRFALQIVSEKAAKDADNMYTLAGILRKANHD